MGEGNVLTRVCPSMILSVHRGGTHIPIMLCNISQNAMRQRGVPGPPQGVPRSGTPPEWGVPGSDTPPGGYPVRYPPGGTQVRHPPRGGYLGQVPPLGGTRSGTPPGGYPGQVPPRGVPRPPRGGTRVGQQKEYSLHGGRYASCVHAGGLSCYHLLMRVSSNCNRVCLYLSVCLLVQAINFERLELGSSF